MNPIERDESQEPDESPEGTATEDVPAPDQAEPAGTDWQARLESLTASELQDLVRKASERELYLDHLRRKAAELENLQKRFERDRLERSRYAGQSLVTQVLPVLDNLEQTIGALGLVADQLRRVLADAGVEPVPCEGKKFDPAQHEAVLMEETGAVEDMTVLQELAKGYRMHDRVIRPAKVKVSRRPAEPADSKE